MITVTATRATLSAIEREIPGLEPYEAERFLAAFVAAQSPASFATWAPCDAFEGVDTRLRDLVHGRFPVRLTERRRTHRPASGFLREQLRIFVDSCMPAAWQIRSVRVDPKHRQRIRAAADLAVRLTGGSRDESIVNVEIMVAYCRGIDVLRHVPLTAGNSPSSILTDADSMLACGWLLGRMSVSARTVFHLISEKGALSLSEIAAQTPFTREACRLATLMMVSVDLVNPCESTGRAPAVFSLTGRGQEIARDLRLPAYVAPVNRRDDFEFESVEGLVM
jgi:hypothetical protein